MKVKNEREVAQTLRDPMDCSPPGSPVHGSFQAGVLEWGAIAFSKPTLERNLNVIQVVPTQGKLTYFSEYSLSNIFE